MGFGLPVGPAIWQKNAFLMRPAPSPPPSLAADPRDPELSGGQRAQVQRALVYIEENLASELTVGEIARVACYAPRHFQRVFHEFTGETVYDFIRRLRAERAAVLLSACGLNVSESAWAVGFQNPSGLYKAFQARYGCTPAARLPAAGEPPTPVPCAVRIEEHPTRRVAFLRHLGDPKGAIRVWFKLLSWARRSGLLRPESPLLGLNYDSTDAAPHTWRYDAAIEVPAGFQPDDASGVAVRDLPGGPVVLHDFRGSLEALEARWNFLTERWFPTSGWRLREPWCCDLHPAAEAAWPRVLRLLVQPSLAIRSTLCIPVRKAGWASAKSAPSGAR